ncbi:MAG: SMP-30/gluconolactonase/LRE family protein [Rubripirellula sp.]
MPETRQAKPLSVPATDALRFLPEGPIPLGESRMSWVGIQHGADAKVGSLNLLDLATGENVSHELPGRPGFAFPCDTPDTFVVGCERELGLFNTKTNHWQSFCEGIDADVTNTIINDGLVYQDNLIFGTKDLEFATKKAGLYLYRGSDKKLIRLRDDQICSNGKAIRSSEAGLELIDIDSPTRQVVCYPIAIEAGTLGEPKVILDLTDDPAVPDGAILTPDQTGIIVAMFRPEFAEHGETRLYDIASGELKCVWQTVGSPQNTCPSLVRHQGALALVITTAVENMSAEDQQRCESAGQLFIGETDIADTGDDLTSRFIVRG